MGMNEQMPLGEEWYEYILTTMDAVSGSAWTAEEVLYVLKPLIAPILRPHPWSGETALAMTYLHPYVACARRFKNHYDDGDGITWTWRMVKPPEVAARDLPRWRAAMGLEIPYFGLGLGHGAGYESAYAAFVAFGEAFHKLPVPVMAAVLSGPYAVEEVGEIAHDHSSGSEEL